MYLEMNVLIKCTYIINVLKNVFNEINLSLKCILKCTDKIYL